MKSGFYASEAELVDHKQGDLKNVTVYHYNGDTWSQRGVVIDEQQLPSDLTFL